MDGQVTWESSSGTVVLYDNGRPVWSVKRGKGKKIPSGGTLVIGREQDCLGGCFDSARGASGKSSQITDQVRECIPYAVDSGVTGTSSPSCCAVHLIDRMTMEGRGLPVL